MAIGRKTRNARAKRSKAAIAEGAVQGVRERNAAAGALHSANRPPWQIFETMHEVSGGEQRTQKLVEILSEGVCAYLTLKGPVRKESPLSGKEN